MQTANLIVLKTQQATINNKSVTVEKLKGNIGRQDIRYRVVEEDKIYTYNDFWKLNPVFGLS